MIFPAYLLIGKKCTLLAELPVPLLQNAPEQ